MPDVWTSSKRLKMLVPQAGLEPARPCGQQILSLFSIGYQYPTVADKPTKIRL
jgi:hypothetical protein